MSRDFFDPTPEEKLISLIDVAILRKAERFIASCEHCNPEVAEIAILDYIILSDPGLTDHILEAPAKRQSVPTVGETFSKRLSLSPHK